MQKIIKYINIFFEIYDFMNMSLLMQEFQKIDNSKLFFQKEYFLEEYARELLFLFLWNDADSDFLLKSWRIKISQEGLGKLVVFFRLIFIFCPGCSKNRPT